MALSHTTGTEHALGQTLDTNAGWIAQELTAAGIHPVRHAVVTDDLAAIRDEIARAAEQADLLIVSGGLGTTADDLTRQALAAAMGVELVLDEKSLERIRDFFIRRAVAMPDANQLQAWLPRGATPLENPVGTAPGIRASLARADVFVLPGVPREMKQMFQQHVRPALAGHRAEAVILQSVVRTYGAPESAIGETLADLMQRGRNPNVGTTAADAIIGVRVNAHGPSRAVAERLLEADVAELTRRLGSLVFGRDDATLQSAVAELLVRQRRTIATAESCTGGLLAKRLTDVPGSSAYFLEGFITYANAAKEQRLAVPSELLARHGAVSREVAACLAQNARRLAGADLALSTTGIAGPTGGTADKPVGLVFIGLASAERVEVKELRLGEQLSRVEIRDRAAKAALNLLRLALL
ncbi:MAG: competence/damage-inducible protein A [Phycisphaerae bacterium]